MDAKQILLDYLDRFSENAALPWGGFKDQAAEEEYFSILSECIKTGVPVSEEQKARLFPRLKEGVIY
jgi:hypothetical protein